MLPQGFEELDRIRDECYAMVTKRAVASGGASLVPVPGADVAADVTMLMQLIPAITRRFGLDRDQVDQLDDHVKIIAFNVIKQMGSKAIGQALTKQVVVAMLKRVGVRVTAKQVLKYIPFAGQAAAVLLSVTAMKYVGNSHVDECYGVCKQIIQGRSKASL